MSIKKGTNMIRWVAIFLTHALLAVPVALAQIPGASLQVDRRFDAFPGALPKSVVPTFVRVHFELDPDRDTFSGEATYTLFVREPVKEIVMHSVGLAVTDAQLLAPATNTAVAGASLPTRIRTDEPTGQVRLELDAPLSVGTRQVSLKFAGKIGTGEEGLYKTQMRDGGVRNMLATQNQPVGARRMLPCFDEPAFRTKWEVSITAPKRFTALSNAAVVSAIPVGDTHTRTRFDQTPSMSSYLLAVAVGEFDKLEEDAHGVRFAIYTPPGKAQMARQAMDWSKSIFGYFVGYFGAQYPMSKFDQIVVPGKSGAMENWGLVTYSEDLLLIDPATASASQQYWAFNVIAHEISHQWFGNLVTMAWWDDLWLNESFASWAALKAARALVPEWNVDTRLWEERDGAMKLDVLPTAKPIERTVKRDTDAYDSFDSITYEKGHAVLNMVEAFAGEEQWQQAIANYIRKYSFGLARASDLWYEVDVATQREIRRFARTWTEQSGFPVIDVSSACQNNKLSVTFKQSPIPRGAGTDKAARWRIALPVRTVSPIDNVIAVAPLPPRTQIVRLERDTVTWDAGECDRVVMIDPRGAGYYRVRYDTATFEALKQHLHRLDAPAQQRLYADTLALATSDLAQVGQLLALVRALPFNAAPQTWGTAVSSLLALLDVTQSDPIQEPIKAALREIGSPKLKSLGWMKREMESGAVRQLRGELIHAMVRADDREALVRVREMFEKRDDAKAPLQGDLADNVIMAVGHKARRADVDAMLAMLTSGKFAALEWPLTRALGSTDDPQVARYVTTLVLDPRVPNAAAGQLLRNLSDAGHGALVFDFVEQNLSALTQRFSANDRRTFYAAALRGGRDVPFAKKVLVAASAKLAPAELSATNIAVEAVERRAAAFSHIKAQLSR